MTDSKNAAKRQRRSYSDEDRAAILRDAEEIGVVEAGKRHGVPKTTISGWRRRAREGNESSSRIAAPTKATVAAKVATAKPTKQSDTPAVGSDAPSSAVATKKIARSYTPSQRAQALEYAAAHGVSAASKKLGISRFALYAWQKQVARAAAGLGDSPTSGPSQVEIASQRDREILAEWRKHPGLGPSQIRNQLRRRQIRVSVSTVRAVMIEAGYRPPKIKREPHNERYEAVRPNHMWHLDFVHRYINKAPTFTLILIDDYSRFVIGHGVDDAERSNMVIRTFDEAVQRHGRPERLMTDKGAAFWSWRGISRFTTLLTEMEVEPLVAKHKEHNGKIEVFNGNLHKEFFNQQRFYNVTEMRQRLAAHLHWYNHGRTHHALGGLLVPADRHYGRADEVLARIESGALRESDDLGLTHRGLELLKLVSKGGTPELWVCGHRIALPHTLPTT